MHTPQSSNAWVCNLATPRMCTLFQTSLQNNSFTDLKTFITNRTKKYIELSQRKTEIETQVNLKFQQNSYYMQMAMMKQSAVNSATAARASCMGPTSFYIDANVS
jgi:hypothetical protein